MYVLDFSEKMISDLKEVLGDKCSYIKYDILKGERLDQKFDLIISDRLVNRFTYWEAVNVIKNSIAMLEENGVVKHAIKLGNYELDNRLIAYAKGNGLALDFWDEETKTIDYTKTKDFLFGCIKEHGNISKDILYKWYLGRGRESRFDHKDIVDIVNSADGKLVSDDNYEANAETRIFCISEALGAFVMGSILSGTAQSEKIVELTKPIKNFFGAIFFVSVGMLVDPMIIVQYWKPILLLTVMIIVAKPFSATCGRARGRMRRSAGMSSRGSRNGSSSARRWRASPPPMVQNGISRALRAAASRRAGWSAESAIASRKVQDVPFAPIFLSNSAG